MRALFVIAGKDLRQRFRDRSALVLAFVAPAAVAGLMSMAFSGVDELHVRLGVVDLDGGPLGEALDEVLAAPELADLLDAERLEGADAVRPALDDGEVDAVVVLPAGFSAAVTAGPGGDVPAVEVHGTSGRPIGADVARSVVEQFVAAVEAGRLAAVAAAGAGAPPDVLSDVAAAASGGPPSVQLDDRPVGARLLQGVDYFGPAMAIFFISFGVGVAARSYLQERREGTLDRMLAAPLPPAVVLGGKVLASAAFMGAAFATMAVVSTVAFGARWGSPPAVVALLVGMVAALTALAGLVTVVARTERQAEAISSVVVFGFAVLGGNFVFLAEAPEALRRLALLTPHGWALRGFTDLATGAEPLGAVALPVAVLAGFSAVVAAVAVVLAPRALVR